METICSFLKSSMFSPLLTLLLPISQTFQLSYILTIMLELSHLDVLTVDPLNRVERRCVEIINTVSYGVDYCRCPDFEDIVLSHVLHLYAGKEEGGGGLGSKLVQNYP